jgi:hypothetical protein
MAQELSDKIRAAAQAKGIDPDTALRIARAESSLSPSAQAKTSSAGGLFQVVDKTWKEFGGAPGKKLDADENIRVGTDIIAKNAQTLKAFLQRDPRPAELYAAHYFGPTGARNFLSADPATPIVDILGKSVVKANPNLQGKNVGQVLAQLETKMGGKPAPAQQASVPRETPPQKFLEADSLETSPPAAAAPATGMREQVASLGPGYQAALALSFLADTDEKEDRDVEKEPGIAEQWLAQTASRPAAMAQFSDIKIRSPFQDEPEQPLMLADGGEVTDPEAALFAGRGDVPAKPNMTGRELAQQLMLGVGELPYLYGGAPVDLAALALTPFGYKEEKPFLGSEYLKDKATKLGIRAPDTKEDRLKGPRVAAEMLSSLTNPAGATRSAVLAAEKGARGAGTAAKMLEDVTVGNIQRGQVRRAGAQAENIPDTAYDPLRERLEASGNLAYAVKPKGGTFAYTPDDTARAKPISDLGKLIQEYGTEARDLGAGDEVLEFLKAKAPKYFTSSYGTADDPLRTAFRDRRIEPFGRDREKIKPYLVDAAANPEGRDQLGAKIDLERAYDDRTGVRAFALKSEDSPISFERDMGRSISAKMGEEGVPIEARNLPDLNAYSPSEFELYPSSSTMLRRLVENQEKLPTNLQQALRTGEPMYDVRPELALLKPTSVIEALQEVPANKLKNMSFPEALIQGTQALAPVRDYLAAITLAEKGAKVPRQALDMFTTPVVKAPSFGGQWVTLDKSVAAKMEGKLMNHSVGDYNSGTSYGTAYTGLPYGGKKAFDEGLVRVYSLRDAEGLPKVTVEMAKSDGGKGNTWNVSQIRGRFNSAPMPEARDDIFRLLNKIDSQDGLATVKTNGYARSATGESVPSTEINWGKEYDLWKQSAE